jgi:hypothetical protein
MHRNVGPVLALGVAAVAAMLGACDTKVGQQADPDMRESRDLRSSAGNVIMGTVCDDTRTCGTDPKSSGPARCATIVEFDQVGACAPACEEDLDCDTVVPGLPFCTVMAGAGSSGKKECVMFCDKDKRVMGLECPTGWTCVSSQGFRICRPPQTK